MMFSPDNGHPRYIVFEQWKRSAKNNKKRNIFLY